MQDGVTWFGDFSPNIQVTVGNPTTIEIYTYPTTDTLCRSIGLAIDQPLPVPWWPPYQSGYEIGTPSSQGGQSLRAGRRVRIRSQLCMARNSLRQRSPDRTRRCRKKPDPPSQLQRISRRARFQELPLFSFHFNVLGGPSSNSHNDEIRKLQLRMHPFSSSPIEDHAISLVEFSGQRDLACVNGLNELRGRCQIAGRRLGTE